MDAAIEIRPATEIDISQIAVLHVESWRETYRGLMSDAVLDDPDFMARREAFWTARLTDQRASGPRMAVATRCSMVVGIAMAGRVIEPDADWDTQLYVLYTYASVHGLGAGKALLDAVVDSSATVGLWVADPNPRAQRFYIAQGFDFDGHRKVEDGLVELRMVRPGSL